MQRDAKFAGSMYSTQEYRRGCCLLSVALVAVYARQWEASGAIQISCCHQMSCPVMPSLAQSCHCGPPSPPPSPPRTRPCLGSLGIGTWVPRWACSVAEGGVLARIRLNFLPRTKKKVAPPFRRDCVTRRDREKKKHKLYLTTHTAHSTQKSLSTHSRPALLCAPSPNPLCDTTH